jgi:hypothetical protein
VLSFILEYAAFSDICWKAHLNNYFSHFIEQDNILLEYTGFAEADILECAAVIARKVGEEPVTASRRQLVAVKRKYDNKKYMNVSIEVEQPDVHDIVGAGGV